ncbi:hypothetical protein Ga0123461_1528 [Mariprofundus aestuarium]|uniref:ASCH domain-containing protein n=2 Tax=Mariprofundus aestuarium TaxID=1921086 RepID=A0A2K8KYT8_MARES|nr:ASCH domain-containing protein [Mariprofundus aestuarium]ATX79942.1 hypothetical protein Ga0123461_1528 [Mariprofundus aestuarium]
MNRHSISQHGGNMNNFPEKTCDISRLVRHPKLVSAALEGNKTEQRRDGIYAYPDEEFELDGVVFIVTALKRQNIGDMSDVDAQAEGYASMEAYKSVILNMHKGMEWKGDAKVWVHCFERKR